MTNENTSSYLSIKKLGAFYAQTGKPINRVNCIASDGVHLGFSYYVRFSFYCKNNYVTLKMEYIISQAIVYGILIYWCYCFYCGAKVNDSRNHL